MKKFILTLTILTLTVVPTLAATWTATDRVSTVGAKILEKNGLPTTTKFQIVSGVADNSTVSETKVINISSADLTYAGNDNEVAAVVSKEIGHIVNGKATKTKLRDMAKTAINQRLNSENIITTAANSTYLTNKESLADNKEADITGADLMIQAGYNPLAGVVVITKMPGSSLETLRSIPANSDRAMNLYDYLTYNYPSKVKAGYSCKEYTTFLNYANPIVEKRNADAKKLAKFNKEQEKKKQDRAKSLTKYKNTGASGWETSYNVLQALINSSETSAK